MRRQIQGAILAIAIISFNAGHVAWAQNLSRVVDDQTGVELALPLDMLVVKKRGRWGTNWQSSGNRLNVDTLNFGNERSLAEVYSTLKNLRGRRLTNNVFDQLRFVLEGTDSDGTSFYVVATERSGNVRGLSIVYSSRSSEPLVRSIVNSFVPFPETAVAQRSTPLSLEPRTSDGASQKLAELTRELDRVKEQLKEQERERERQKEVDRIRKQERERLEQEFALREQERKSRSDEEKAREKRADQRLAEDRDKAREREAEIEGRIAALRKEFNLRQQDATSKSSARTPGKRVALIIGIDKYAQLGPSQQLRTAANDARLVAATFEKLGFQVIETSLNVSRTKFNRDWQRFLNSVERGSVASFFFAGHGIQVDGQNYLLPSDVPPAEMGQAEYLVNEAISLNVLLDQMAKQGPRLSLIILDACRDNPFSDGTRGASTRGLAKTEVAGTFIMYSAAAGQAALDRLPDENGDNHNSVYTRTLVPLLLQEGLTINQVAIRVRQEVARMAAGVSSHQQHPAYYDGLREGSLCLMGNCADTKAVAK